MQEYNIRRRACTDIAKSQFSRFHTIHFNYMNANPTSQIVTFS